MCAVSMVYDYGRRDLSDWQRGVSYPLTDPARLELEKRVKALEYLLAATKKYDDATGQPDCGAAAKKAELQKLAEQLGVKIAFPE